MTILVSVLTVGSVRWEGSSQAISLRTLLSIVVHSGIHQYMTESRRPDWKSYYPPCSTGAAMFWKRSTSSRVHGPDSGTAILS